MSYPALEIDLEGIRHNAEVLKEYCRERGLSLTGVAKMTDGDMRVAEAFIQGGCEQIAFSRLAHIKELKRNFPGVKSLLLRIPMLSELEDAAKYCDCIMVSEGITLTELDKAAAASGTVPGIVLMYETGDMREGTSSLEELLRLAKQTENAKHLELKGIATTFACASGVLPNRDSLMRLSDAADRIETLVEHPLEIVSGGSSINFTLLSFEKPMPPKINNLRVGCLIPSPGSMNRSRGIVIPGVVPDCLILKAEIIEIKERDTDKLQQNSLNWKSEPIEVKRMGIRKRAILAVGSQDAGNCGRFTPLDPRVKMVTCSSDHTIADITDCGDDYKVGDVLSFKLCYENMLYSFCSKHVEKIYK